MTGFWIVFAVVFAIVIWSAHKKSQEKEDARERYVSSLAQLKERPSDPELRQTTLALGRVYSNLMRDRKGNTVFDELTLMNDINAACAAAQPSYSNAATISSLEDRLRQLQELLDKKLIDNAEYAARKQEILKQI